MVLGIDDASCTIELIQRCAGNTDGIMKCFHIWNEAMNFQVHNILNQCTTKVDVEKLMSPTYSQNGLVQAQRSIQHFQLCYVQFRFNHPAGDISFAVAGWVNIG